MSKGANEWISVQDRLPDAGTSNWVKYHFGQTEAWYINKMFWVRGDMETEVPQVTHYIPLPLPEPPEQDK